MLQPAQAARPSFLAELKGLLQLNPGDTIAIEREADAIVDLAESAVIPLQIRMVFGIGKAHGVELDQGAATGVAASFASTYALGQLAKRYYAGERTMNNTVLRQTFQGLLGPARQLQTQYLPQIQQQARTLDMGQVMAMVRGA